jgi:hypothetical protein
MYQQPDPTTKHTQKLPQEFPHGEAEYHTHSSQQRRNAKFTPKVSLGSDKKVTTLSFSSQRSLAIRIVMTRKPWMGHPPYSIFLERNGAIPNGNMVRW